ncbi:uncharacterized protein LY79DRAFT_538823 [Colletotrichum navitas]|uniref:Uncharacterized protein n=1 Tax=Colletotrichum navitas TaxID=681940 RepID=A0AAD8QBM3_9PEZI|nr:uncharacterized protein LY79DRAFT_538823 [Colletotrichum navitas]KAK1598318.1 hypothetical protein LY79DRAFT_538823 [Colletotrichum navitas]
MVHLDKRAVVSRKIRFKSASVRLQHDLVRKRCVCVCPRDCRWNADNVFSSLFLILFFTDF